MKKLILLAVIGVSLHCNAQISRDSAYDFLKTTILNGNWEDKEILVSSNLIPENTIITTFGIGFDTFAVSPNYKTWFFYVDEEPTAQWHRKCKYVFINEVNNFVVIDMTTPPNYTELIELHKITPRIIGIDTSKWETRYFLKNINTSTNDYAVIISGGSNPKKNWSRYWNDCSAMYKSLVNVFNYDKNKIFVIMSDGTNPADDYNIGSPNTPAIYASLPLDLDGDGSNDVQYAATKSNIAMVFDTLSQRITSDDNVFVFVTDHGGYGSTISLWNNTIMTKTEFASEINKINHARSINICMEQCYSGGYTTALAGNNRVIATACSAIENSWPMPNLVYDEFCYHWISAVSGYTPDTKDVVDADYNNDNFVSMEEAFQYARNADTRNETPQYSSPSSPNLGKYLTLNGFQEYDLYTRDNKYENGNEPLSNFVTEGFANSPDIWLRKNADNETEHQSGTPGVENHIYIRIHNRGNHTSYGNDTVKLYVKRVGLNPNVWSNGWSMIGKASIPQIPSGSFAIVRIDGVFPVFGSPSSAPVNVDFAMLSRIESKFDGLYITETTNTGFNIVGNNNISYKNVAISNAVIIDDDVVTDVVVTALDNPTNDIFYTTLKFTSPSNEVGDPLFEEAEIRLVFPKTLVQSWGSSYTLSGAKKINDSTFLVTGSSAKMENISIPANYNGYMMAQVNFLTEEYSEKDKYEYIVEQTDPTTGEYQNGLVMIVDKTLRSNLFAAEGGENIIANANVPVNLSATAIGEDAVYNWYDASGVLVNSGQNIAVTSSQTQKYTLEVTAKADGYKDYDSVYVIRTLGNIASISPNPASGHAVVTYNLTSSVSAASIVVTNSSGLAVYSSAIDVSATTHTLNVQNLVAGQYSVRLLSATGEVLDTKTLIVQ